MKNHVLGPGAESLRDDVFGVGCACNALVTERTCWPNASGAKYLGEGVSAGASAVLLAELRPAFNVDVTGATRDGSDLAVEYTTRFPHLPTDVRLCLEHSRTAWLRWRVGEWVVVAGSDRRRR